MAWPKERISSFDDFMKIVARYREEDGFLFRGQGNAKWQLTPSIVREFGGKGLRCSTCLDTEREALARFRRSAPLFHEPADVERTADLFSCWALMQHFAAPTRLLDWTSSPFIALYFAVERPSATDDAAVWVVKRQVVAAALAARGGGSFPVSGDREATFFAETDAPDLYFQEPDVSNERLYAQKGWFSVARQLLCNHDTLIDQLLAGGRVDPAEAILKIVIPARARIALLRSLGPLNISADRLFPGPDGHGRSVAEFLRLKVDQLEPRSKRRRG